MDIKRLHFNYPLRLCPSDLPHRYSSGDHCDRGPHSRSVRARSGHAHLEMVRKVCYLFREDILFRITILWNFMKCRSDYPGAI